MLNAAVTAPGRVAGATPLYLARTEASFARVASLDGLRAVSILLVMLSHFVDSRFFPGGLGVLIFFVVSGFLITRLLFAEAKAAGRISLGNFYLRRFFRLYPVITVYAVVVVAYCVAARRPVDWYEPASALFYFANYLYAWSSMAGHAGATRMPFAIFWSLSVEEHFYLFFPLLFAWVRGRALLVMLAGICALCLALRCLLALAHPEWLDTHIFYYTDMRLDSIAFGVLLAAIAETPGTAGFLAMLQTPRAVAAAAMTILLCLLVRAPLFRETLRYTLLGAGIAVLLAAVVFSPRYGPVQAVLNWPAMRWIGALSYSLYVWHTFLPIPLHAMAPNLPPLLEPPVVFALALAIASLSYYGLEKPAAALRHRFGSRTVDTPMTPIDATGEANGKRSNGGD